MQGIDRIVWIDYSKVIGLLFVICAHLYTVHGTGEENLIRTYIYGFHMPFFFFVSGMLFKPRTNGLADSLLRNFKSLLVPYLIFNFIFAIIYGIIDNTVISNIFKIPIHIIKGEGNACKASWFIACLFNIKCFFDILYYKGWLNIGIILTFIFSFVLVYVDIKGNWFYLASTVFGLFFYWVGYFSKKYIQRLKFRNVFCILSAILCFTISYVFTLYNGKVSMYSANVGNSIILFYTNAMIGSMGIIWLGMGIESNRKYIVSASCASLGVVLLHMCFVDIVKMFIRNIDGSYMFFIINLICSVLIYCICVILYQIMNKYIPIVWGKF